MFTWVREKLEETELFGEEIHVQRRLGVIGRIDETLEQFESGRITRQRCLDQLVRLFEVINESPQRQEISYSLLEYIDAKYGKTFPLQSLEDRLPQIEAFPLRWRRRKEEFEDED